MKKHAHIVISGRVQGVGFRMYAVDQAEELNLTGWVRNRDDGCVEVVAEGEETDVDAFVEWCKSGPESAEVSATRVTFSEPNEEFDAFTIRYSHV